MTADHPKPPEKTKNMKLKKIMILELTELETDALKMLIGKTSEKARLDLGLTIAQSNLASVIYDHLPNLDEGKDA
jgi:hypothetical protein